MNYRSQPLELSTRITLATEMLMPIPPRPWGYATRLAETFGVSLSWLYERILSFGMIESLLKHRASGVDRNACATVTGAATPRRLSGD